MDTFNLRKFLKENKVKEATIINPEDLPEDEIEDSFGNKIRVREIGVDIEEEGLIVRPKDQVHANMLNNAIEESGLHAEWDVKEGHFFFPEEEDLYDVLEEEIQNLMDENNIQASIEGVFNENLKEFDDESIEQYGDAMKQALGSAEAPAHITALAIAAEDAYEEMGNVDEVLKFVEMHLKGAYGD